MKQIVEALENNRQVQAELIDLASNLVIFGMCRTCKRAWHETNDLVLGDCSSGFHAEARKAMALWEQIMDPLADGSNAF